MPEYEVKEVKPFKFFPQLKGIVGYRKNETYTLPGLVQMVEEKKLFPVEVDEKYDGMRVQIHKGKTYESQAVQIFTEDGANVSHKFPTIMKEAKLMSDRDFVLDAEIVGWSGDGYRIGKHIGRSDVSGYAHRSGEEDDSHFYANVFDIVYYSEDIHNRSLSGRRIALNDLKPTTHIIPIDFKIAKDREELVKAVEYFRRRAGSEGAMIKKLMSDYPLSGQTDNWIKFKNEVDIDAEVVSKYKVSGSQNAFNYLCAIRDTVGRLVPVGNTYNTKIDVPVGGIIRVSFVNLNRYTDPKTGKVWYNWVFPRPLEAREDKTVPDSTVLANRQVGMTKGEDEQKPFPSRYKRALKDFESGNYEVHDSWTCPCGTCNCSFIGNDGEYQDVFLEYPERGKPLKYVIQAHIRGRSVHIDDRRQLDDENSVGMTHFVPKSLSKRPETIEEAKALYFKEIHPTIVKMMNDPMDKFLSGQKALVPNEWLTVEGKIEKQEPGSTENLPGFMIVIDQGNVEYGTLKPYYHEYWYKSNKGESGLMKGKYVDRLIENKAEQKKIDNELASWLFFKSDAIPYVATSRSVEKEFVPPFNVSALPKHIEDNVPGDLSYWLAKSTTQRMELHKKFVEAVKAKRISLNNIQGFALPPGPGINPPQNPIEVLPRSAVMPTDTKFTLSRQDWKGQMVSRLGPSKTIYHLAIDDGESKGVKHFFVMNDMTHSESVSAIYKPATTKKIMDLQGAVAPGTAWNPTKDTPSTIELLDRNMPAKIIKWDDEKRTIAFNGKRLIGVWEFRKESKGSDLWYGEKHTDGFMKGHIEMVKSWKSTDSFHETVGFEATVDSINVFPFEVSESEDPLPKFIEITGKYFYPGKHKCSQGIKRNYSASSLAKTKFKAPKNFNLAYINWYHMKDESYRAGILCDVWWDPNVQIEGASEKGSLMYRGIIFHRDAIAEIINNNTKNVSAELYFDIDGKDEEGNPNAVNIIAQGMAMTPTPALAKASVDKVCVTSQDGKRSCKDIKKAGSFC